MKKQTHSFRDVYFAAECAALLLVSLALSYLECIIPVTSVVPIPGFKLGFANIAIVVAFYRLSPSASFLISITRIAISSILFSGITTLAFSICGAILSFAVLLIMSSVPGNKFSFIGISIMMALFHNIGQLICACFVMNNPSIVYYFPVLAAAALICGALSGVILSLLPDMIYTRKVRQK